MKKHFIWLTAITLLSISKVFGQCPGTPSVTVQSQTAASCPSNGSVTLGGNGIGNVNVLYKIIAAPNSSYVGTMQQGTSPTFANLEPGNYKIEMSCTGGSILRDTAAFTIANSYVAPSADLTSSSSCSGGTAQITLSLSNIQGSSQPLQYAFYQTSDPNIADNLLTYGSATSMDFTSFGNFIVRIKDACGNVITKPINVAAPPTYYISPSNPSVVACDKLNWVLFLKDSANSAPDQAVFPAGGLTINIYYPQAPGSCTKGALYYTHTYAGGTSTAGITYPTPRQRFIVEAINSCGQAISKCIDTNLVKPSTSCTIKNSSCSVPASTVKLVPASIRFFGTVNYCAYQNNVLIGCSSNPNDALFSNIPSAAGDKFYVVATDQCGLSATSDTLTTPTSAPSVHIGWVSLSCTDGKLSVSLDLSDVPKPDLASLIITSGPCCVGTTIGSNLTNGIRIDDILVPGTYTAKITYPGGECLDISGLTFTIVEPNSTQGFTATVSQTCGGGASITAIVSLQGFTTWGNNTSIMYQLVDASNTIVQNNTNGIFNNVNPGTYVVKGIVTYAGCIPNKVVTSQKTVMVTAAGAPPVINKKYGIICEGSNGTLLNSGSALFYIAGFGPYDVYYSTVNNQPGTPQLTGASSPVTITGLTANQTYYFWFKDACGNTSSTQLGIISFGKIWVEQSIQPCVGSPFQLSLPDYPTATYSWKDKNGNVISSSRIKDFGNYQATADGDYTGIMSLANGCVVRTVDVSLNSVLCGTPLPLKLLSFNAKKAGAYNALSWTTAEEKNVAHFEIERSTDGGNWNAIGIMGVDDKEAITHNYFYDDQQPTDGTNYYRLKIVDKDQRYQYSQVVVIRTNGAVSAGATIHIYPNPTHATATIELPADALGAQMSIYNSVGQQVAVQSVSAQQTTISTETYAAGVYYVVITKNGTVLYREKLTKF